MKKLSKVSHSYRKECEYFIGKLNELNSHDLYQTMDEKKLKIEKNKMDKRILDLMNEIEKEFLDSGSNIVADGISHESLSKSRSSILIDHGDGSKFPKLSSPLDRDRIVPRLLDLCKDVILTQQSVTAVRDRINPYLRETKSLCVELRRLNSETVGRYRKSDLDFILTKIDACKRISA
ncbi:MAG: hypothetical protein AAFY36_18595, partial [Bacteroidota bacterium]